MKHILFAILCSLFTILLGCGGGGLSGLVPAKGTVTLDGTPIDGVTLVLTADGGHYATGITSNGGQFTLETVGKPGVLPGKYKAALSKIEIVPLVSAEEAKRLSEATKEVPSKTEHHIPQKYEDAATSGIEIDIPANGNKAIKIELKK